MSQVWLHPREIDIPGSEVDHPNALPRLESSPKKDNGEGGCLLRERSTFYEECDNLLLAVVQHHSDHTSRCLGIFAQFHPEFNGHSSIRVSKLIIPAEITAFVTEGYGCISKKSARDVLHFGC